MDTDKKRGVDALERAFAILDAFRGEQSSLSLSELSEKTGFYKSTILRLYVSLERYGYLSRLPSGRFVLGGTLFQLGQIYQRSFRLRDYVTPFLDLLSQKTRESASFWIREGEHRVCLYRAESSHNIRDAVFREGDRRLLDKGPTSTVLQAFSGAKGKRFDEAREDGVVVSLGLYAPDVAGISCPVFQSGGSLAGALTLTGPLSRFPTQSVSKIKALVRDAAKDLTRSLCGETVPRKIA